MDIGSIFFMVFFVVLTCITIVAVKCLFEASFLMACLIGIPVGFGIGMLLIWIFGHIGRTKHK